MRSLLIELENISEKNKKINSNNLLKKQLNDIDIHEYKRLLNEHPEEADTRQYIEGVASWKSEQTHEHTMYTKYAKLAQMENATCPTCDGEIDQDFVNNMLQEHKERMEQCEKFADKDRERLQELEKANALHRTAKREIKDWEDLYRSIDHELTTSVLNEDDLKVKVAELREQITTAKSALQEVIDENDKERTT